MPRPPIPFTALELEAWNLLNLKGYTQRQIARRLKISESAVSQRLRRLATRHNIPLHHLKPSPKRRFHPHSLSRYPHL